MNESTLTRMLARLGALAMRSHYSCEDCWYSCPESEEGCCNDAEGEECNCGADSHNAEVTKLLTQIKDQMIADDWRSPLSAYQHHHKQRGEK